MLTLTLTLMLTLTLDPSSGPEPKPNPDLDPAPAPRCVPGCGPERHARRARPRGRRAAPRRAEPGMCVCVGVCLVVIRVCAFIL